MVIAKLVKPAEALSGIATLRSQWMETGGDR